MSIVTEPHPGCLRRRVVMETRDDLSRASMEDSFHCFSVTIRHDGARVREVVADSMRPPWSLCAEGGAVLADLVNTPLSLSPQLSPQLDTKQYCTHQFDLALLAIAQAVRGGRRQYDIVVPDAEMDAPVKEAVLFRDGEEIYHWCLKGTEFISPALFAGRNLRTISHWLQDNLNADEREAFAVLRRSVLVSGGRLIDLDQFEDTSRVFEHMVGACYVYQKDRIGLAKRNKGSTRDFSERPQDLLIRLKPL